MPILRMHPAESVPAGRTSRLQLARSAQDDVFGAQVRGRSGAGRVGDPYAGWPDGHAHGRAIVKMGQFVKLIFVLGIACLSARAQARFYGDFQIGDFAGLGFKPPYVAVSAVAEIPLGSHFEDQPIFTYSPDAKAFDRYGTNLNVTNRAIYWRRVIGLQGGVDVSAYWQAGLKKHAWTPFAGAAFRYRMLGFPSRSYLAYLLPTGCQKYRVTNPCQIQSSRTQGIYFQQEWVFYHWMTYGAEIQVLHFLDQGNPMDFAAGRNAHWTMASDVHVRFGWGPRGRVY